MINIELKQFIEKNTNMTGSKAYGLPKAEDHDRFCNSTTYEQLQDMLANNSIPFCRGKSIGESIQFTLDGENYDIFVVHHEELQNIILVTEFVKQACKMYPKTGINKVHRIALFEMIRAILKEWKGINK